MDAQKGFLDSAPLEPSGLGRAMVFCYREFMSSQSRKAFRRALDAGSYEVFRKRMKRVLFFYEKVLHFRWASITGRLRRLLPKRS